MNWSEEKEANKEIPYTHIICDTPLGRIVIDWKGWKAFPSYDISINYEYIGSSSSLDISKEIAKKHIVDKYNILHEFLNKQQ